MRGRAQADGLGRAAFCLARVQTARTLEARLMIVLVDVRSSGAASTHAFRWAGPWRAKAAHMQTHALRSFLPTSRAGRCAPETCASSPLWHKGGGEPTESAFHNCTLHSLHLHSLP